jgi:flagellar protein FlaG
MQKVSDMNSEITNVSTLVPATVVKSNRQNEDSASVKADAGIINQVDSESEPVTAASSAKEKESGSKVTSLDTLKSAAVTGNSILQAANRNLEFKIDDSTKRVVVKIVDSQTGETVRQIPSEDMLAFIKQMQELDGKKGSVIQSRA